MAKGIKTGGRQKGVPNKATADIRALAMEHTPEAFLALMNVIRTTESDAARVAAIKELFDRGFGKARQAMEVSGPDGGPIQSETTLDLSSLTLEQKRALASIKIGE